MQVAELICRHVLIPLKRRVSHASFSRTSTDSLVVSCRLTDGTVGWGESLPRDYVTGETVETAFEQLAATDLRQPLSREITAPSDLLAMSESLAFAPLEDGQRDCFGNALKCAVELAILDAGCRSLGISLSEFTRHIPESSGIDSSAKTIQYSGAITSSNYRKIPLYCWIFRAWGFRHCKLKVGFEGVDDERLVRTIRRHIGPKMNLRIDANEAWTCENLASKLKPLLPYRIDSVEQPVPHDAVAGLADVRTQISVPIMLDESLCSLGDADRAIAGGWCDIFNIRLSKCGGYVNSVKLAAKAKQAGLGFQLGAQVGETGILSAVGRHFACSIDGWSAVEGSFDKYLVRERLTRQDLTFGYRGRGRAINGLGTGVDVDLDAVRRVTRQAVTVPLA